MRMPFLKSLRLDGFLSFAPGSPAIELRPLNVLIGPNGSGKSNLIEAIELLKAAPSGFGGVLRLGGGVDQWIWKGGKAQNATIEVGISRNDPHQSLRYELGLSASRSTPSIEKEVFESVGDELGSTAFSYLRYGDAQGEIAAKSSGDPQDTYLNQKFERRHLNSVDPVIAQRRDPLIFPDIAWLVAQLGRIRTFRDWSFGRFAKVRQPQSADLPNDELLPDAGNLALVVQEMEHRNGFDRTKDYLRRFLPRFERLSVSVGMGGVMLYLHEDGIEGGIPSTRISDGTMRFIALLAVLLGPDPPPVLCIEEPELGLHPDAMDTVAKLLVEASTRSQVVVTTHSDVLVSALTDHADSVLICEHLGGTVVSRVDSEKLKFWLDKYRLGEIWRIGKLGGNP